MKKKALKTIIATAIILPVLAGCGGKAAAPATGPATLGPDTPLSDGVPMSSAVAENGGNYDEYMEIEMDAEATVDSYKGDDSYYSDIYYNYYDEDDYDINNEEYAKIEEQGYKSVIKHPLSTFAADIDTASYSNVRRLLNDGYSIYNLPEGSVRIEEFINYFDYDYKDPVGAEPFGVNMEISDCPWNDKAKLFRAGLKTEDIDFSETPSSNLVFLIDVSGSMSDYDKLPLLQEAFCMLVDELSEKDRVSIVTYANGVDAVLKGAKGSEKNKIKTAINDLFAGGGTNGEKGLQMAYELAEKNFIEGGNNRIILATDGDLNIGLTTVEELEDFINKKRETGVYFSVLGFGTGNIKDDRMETLADKGNGNYAYIDSVKEAKKVLVDELTSNMLTVCKDVKLQVEFNPAVVEGYRLVGYTNRTMKNKDFNDDTKDGGEIGAGHEVTAMYELILKDEIPDDDIDEENLRYADQFKKEKQETIVYDKNDEILTLNIRYKKPGKEETESNLLTYPVTFENYRTVPSDDFIFQSAVAEFGLIAADSEYKGNADIDNVKNRLASIKLNDEYKQEFADIIRNQSETPIHTY